MAITYVSSSTERFAASTEVSPAEPASVQEDDVFLALVVINDDSGSFTAPSGWTAIDTQTESINSQHWWLGYIVRGASTPALSWTYSGVSDDIRCVISAWRGVDTANVLDVTWALGSHYGTTIDSAVSTNPAITTNNDDAVVVLYDQTDFQASGTPGAPTNYTLDNTGHGSQPQINMAHREITSAGLETPGAWTHTGYSVGADHRNWTVALREEVAASGIVITVPTGPWR